MSASVLSLNPADAAKAAKKEKRRPLAKWVTFTPKDLAKKMGSCYTVPLFDREEKDATGRSTRKFYLKSHNGSQLTAEYILMLLRHLDDIIQLPSDVQELIREDNDIRVWGDLYALNSTDLNSKLSDSISGTRGNVSSGNAGNIAVAYFTPYISPICHAALASRGIELSSKTKLLSQDQVDQLRNMEAYLVLDKENKNIGIPLKHLAKDDLDFAIEHWKREGFTPVRIIFDNLMPGHANVFNTKPVNDKVKVVMRNEIKKFFHLRGARAEFLSSATLREKYGVTVQDAVKRRLTNHGFWCTFDHNDHLREIYVLQYKELYYAKVNNYGQFKVQFGENSFVDKSVKRKDDVLYLKSKGPDGVERDVEVVDLDICNVFERTNYQSYLTKNAGRGKQHRINLYDYIIDSCGEKIEELLSTTKELSTYHGDNMDDESVQKLLSLLAKKPESVFSLVKTSSETTGLSDTLVQLKSSAKSGIRITYFDRAVLDSPKRTNDNGSVVNYVNLHKSNLAFEREKAMTVLFVQAAVDWLKQEGHVDIHIELEKVTKKKNGETGYLDCGIYSKKDGISYGQIYEFKSWYDFEPGPQAVLREQCVSYDIRNTMTKRAVTVNYSDETVHQVKGMNLTKRGAFPLTGENCVPWLPNTRWPFDFPEIKSTEQKDIPLLTALDVSVVGEQDITDAAAAFIPDLVEEAKEVAAMFSALTPDASQSGDDTPDASEILGFN